MATDKVLYDVVDGVAIITLNEPDKLNPLGYEMVESLLQAFQKASTDNKVSVVIITGSGKAFSSGGDIRSISGLQVSRSEERMLNISTKQKAYDMIQELSQVPKVIANFDKLVIAAINGTVAGGGISLALACDFQVMSEDALFHQAFLKIALVPDMGATYFLVKKLGYSKALEFSLQGKPLSAKKCEELGLVNKVVPASKLLEASLAWAKELSKLPKDAVSLTKSVMHFATLKSLSEVIDYEATVQQYLLDSEDHRNAIKAFQTKKQPNFNRQAIDLPRGVKAKL